MSHRLRRGLGAAVIALWLLVTATVSVAAETPAYIPLATTPDEIPDYVYYYQGNTKVNPSAFTWESGRNGGMALRLNGTNQYLRLATAQVKTLSAFTFSSWVRWNEAEEGAEQNLLTFYRNENYYISVSLQGETAEQGIVMKWVLPDRDPIVVAKAPTEGSSFAFPRGEWHHLAVVASNTELSLYIDGACFLTQAVSVDFKGQDLRTFKFGSDFDNKPCLSASFEDARLYPAALSADQIAVLAADATADNTPLATRPVAPTTQATLAGGASGNSAADTDETLFGLPQAMVITLGAIVAGVILLSVVFSLQKGAQPVGEEENQ